MSESKIEKFSTIDKKKSLEYRSVILKNFGTIPKYTYPLWENLQNYHSVQDIDAWIWLLDFHTTEPIIMIFEYQEEERGFIFESMKDVVLLLGNCYGFVFYLTSLNGDYLLCINDHDYLIAGGKAKNWLEEHSINNYEKLRAIVFED